LADFVVVHTEFQPAERIVGRQCDRLFQRRDRLLGASLFYQKIAEIHVRLLARMGVLLLPRDRFVIRIDGRVGLGVRFKDQSQIIFGPRVVWIEVENCLKRFPRLDQAGLGVVGAAQVVPGIGILGVERDRPFQPFGGIRIVVQQDVVETNDFEIIRWAG